jgi:beta-lactamase regulating signal transducer with metallopeptidase domain
MSLTSVLAYIQAAFAHVLETSWHASILVALILATQWMLRRRLAPAWRCGLWLLLLVRLLMPALPHSSVSLFSLAPPLAHHADDARLGETTRIIFGARAPEALANHSAPASSHIAVKEPGFNAATISQLVALIWLFGVLFVLARAIVGHRCFIQRLASDSEENSNPDLDELLHDCCRRIGIARPPDLIHTSAIKVPAVCGVVKPAILLPSGLAGRLSRQELTFVLLHELVHLKRRDVLSGWIVYVLNAVHWFNPVLWLAASRFRGDRELACDAHVLALTGRASWHDYGQTILALLDNLVVPMRSAGAVGLGTQSTLRLRIAAIADPVIAHSRLSPLGLLVMLALGCATLTSPKRPGGATATTASANTDGLVERIYDVQDLLGPTHRDDTDVKTTYDEFGWPSIAVKPQPTSSQLDATRHEKLDQLVSTVKKQIDPASWSGQTMNSISADQRTGQLIVSQSSANQEKIQELLQSMRASPDHLQVSLKTRFLTGEGINAALQQIGGEWQPRDGAEMWSKLLSPAEVERVLEAIRHDPKTTTLSAPRLILFNGQRAFVMVATSTAYIAEVSRIKAQDGSTAFDPLIKNVHSGIVLDAHVDVTDNGKSIALDVRPHVARLLSLEKVLAPGSEAGKGPFIQLPRVSTSTLATKVSVPDQQTVVMRITPQLKSAPGPSTHPATTATDDVTPTICLFNPAIIRPSN